MTDVSARRRDQGKFAIESRSAADLSEVEVDDPWGPPPIEAAEPPAQPAIDQPGAAPEPVEPQPDPPVEVPAPIDRKHGEWEIADAVAEHMPADEFEGVAFSRTRLHIGGEPHRRGRNRAAAALLAETEQQDAVDARVRSLAASGSQMTVLAADSSGGVRAYEGRGMATYDDRIAMISKGSRTKGRYFDDRFRPIAVVPGYGGQAALAEAYHRQLARVPETAPVDFDGIPDVEADHRRTGEYAGSPDTIAAAYLIENADFNGGTVPGCMFMATDYDRENDIVNGYFWAPGDSGLYSETSSMYGKDLQRTGGRIKDYRPGSLRFSDCYDGTVPGGRGEAYRAVLGKPHQRGGTDAG